MAVVGTRSAARTLSPSSAGLRPAEQPRPCCDSCSSVNGFVITASRRRGPRIGSARPRRVRSATGSAGWSRLSSAQELAARCRGRRGRRGARRRPAAPRARVARLGERLRLEHGPALELEVDPAEQPERGSSSTTSTMEPPITRRSLRPYGHLLRRIDAPKDFTAATSIEENPLLRVLRLLRVPRRSDRTFPR